MPEMQQASSIATGARQTGGKKKMSMRIMADTNPPAAGPKRSGKQGTKRRMRDAPRKAGARKSRPPEDAGTKSEPEPMARGPVALGSGPSFRQSYAAIDLGTNNCRLLIARPSGEAFTVIDAFSRVVRLGEGLAQSGRLSDAAMDRTLAALRICADKLMRRGVYLARSVATEACRQAANGEDFIARVREIGRAHV